MTQHSQSLASFRQSFVETLDRLSSSNGAEILTVDGEIHAVLLSPAAFHKLTREAEVTQDVKVVRQAMRQIDDGLGLDVTHALNAVREELLSIESGRDGEKSKL